MPKYLVQCESRHVQYYEFEAENEMDAVKNAKEMAELNSALYLDDTDCTPESFMEKLEEIINDTQKMIELQNNAKKLVKYDATDNIVNQIKDALK